MLELDDILQRVTRAEEKMTAVAARNDDRHAEAVRAIAQVAERTEERHAETLEAFTSVDARLKGLELSLAKYTGFWGAIMLIGSAITTFFMLTKEFFATKLGVHS